MKDLYLSQQSFNEIDVTIISSSTEYHCYITSYIYREREKEERHHSMIEMNGRQHHFVKLLISKWD